MRCDIGTCFEEFSVSIEVSIRSLLPRAFSKFEEVCSEFKRDMQRYYFS